MTVPRPASRKQHFYDVQPFAVTFTVCHLTLKVRLNFLIRAQQCALEAFVFCHAAGCTSNKHMRLDYKTMTFCN